MIDPIKERVAEKKHRSNSTVGILLNMGADVTTDFRPLQETRLTTALIAYCVSELETIIASGAVMDQLTADLILEHDDDGLSCYEYLRITDLT